MGTLVALDSFVPILMKKFSYCAPLETSKLSVLSAFAKPRRVMLVGDLTAKPRLFYLRQRGGPQKRCDQMGLRDDVSTTKAL
jgi:hypothetical protein